MIKPIKTILKVINITIITVAVLLAVVILGFKLTGIQMFTVLSGSMEPAYPVGSLICVRKVAPEELESGDVITFKLSANTIATHRIVEVVPDEENPDLLQYRTKGDANEVEDAGLVSSEKLIGTPFLMVPKLGYFAAYVQTPSGRTAAIAIGAALLLFVFTTDSLVNDKKKGKQDGSEDEIK